MDPTPEKLLFDIGRKIKEMNIPSTIRNRNNNGDHDLDVQIGSSKIKMHRDLFVMASPDFFCLLQTAPVSEGVSKVSLKIDIGIFKGYIYYFIYNGHLPADMSFSKMMEVLEVSVAYRIDGLITHIADSVPQYLTNNQMDALVLLETARACEHNGLEDLALTTILKNGNSFLNEGVSKLARIGLQDIYRILSSDELCCDREADVLKAAMLWAEGKATGSSNRVKFQKYYFSQIKGAVRFPLIDAADLADATLGKDEVFDEKELIFLLQCASVPEVKRPPAYLKKYGCNARNSARINGTNPLQTDTENSQADSGSTYGFVTPRKEMKSDLSSAASPMFGSSSRSTRRSSLSVPNTPCDKNSISKVEPQSAKRKRRRLNESGSDSDCFEPLTFITRSNKCYPTYDHVMSSIAKMEEKDYQGTKLTDIEIESDYRIVEITNSREFFLDAKLPFLPKPCPSTSSYESCVKAAKPFLDFISKLDPMRYIAVRNNIGRVYVDNLWTMLEKIHLKFNGVTFLKVDRTEIEKSSTLVLNYLSDSKKILNHRSLRPTNLALSNCEFSLKSVKDKGIHLKRLTLYRVWGDYTLKEIVERFPKLTQLVCWKYVPDEWISNSPTAIPLSLNILSLTNMPNLRKLVLFEAELLCSTDKSVMGTAVAELVLDHCYTKQDDCRKQISQEFPIIFPMLQKLTIKEEEFNAPGVNITGNLAISDLINAARCKIDSVKEISVKKMKWKVEGSPEDMLLTSFLKECQHNRDPAQVNERPEVFTLRRIDDSSWKLLVFDDRACESTNIDNGYWSEEDKREYEYYNLSNFYDTYEVFEDYFVQMHGFPTPMLWV